MKLERVAKLTSMRNVYPQLKLRIFQVSPYTLRENIWISVRRTYIRVISILYVRVSAMSKIP